MNQQPVSYLQTDPRWSAKDYSARGEKTTIGASGCGPTAMAMVLATWADPQVTPATECAWALAHGYKAPRQGTYYGYFPPAAARYGLTCRQMNWSSLYGNPNSSLHAQAKGEIAKAVDKLRALRAGVGDPGEHRVPPRPGQHKTRQDPGGLHPVPAAGEVLFCDSAPGQAAGDIGGG